MFFNKFAGYNSSAGTTKPEARKMFFKKKDMQTKSREELEREREERIKETSDKIKVQLITMNNKKDALLSNVVAARRKGLKEPENQARAVLARYLASIKRAEGMLLTLELAVQTRDLAKLNYEFLQCIGDLSDDISQSTQKFNAKKIEEKYTKALYNSSKQLDEIDKFLEIGDYAAAVSADTNSYSEFNEEIDMLIENAENAAMSGTQAAKNKLF